MALIQYQSMCYRMNIVKEGKIPKKMIWLNTPMREYKYYADQRYSFSTMILYILFI